MRDLVSDWSKLADSRLAKRGARIAAIAVLLALVVLGTLFLIQVTSTSGDEVAGGSDETLPSTGGGSAPIGGLAGMLVAAGVILLLLVRGRSQED